MRGGGGVIGLVMGATGTTERERLLGRGTRAMVCAFIPASDGRISSKCVASRRVVLPVQLFRPNLQAQSAATWMLTWIYI